MAGQRRAVGGVWFAWALAGALLLSACGGGGGGGGAPAVSILGGSAVKGVAQFARITAQELDVNGAVVRELGTAVTDAQGVYSLDLPASYTGGPILLTLSDNLDPARPTMVKCDRRGGCGTAYGFGDPMPIGSLVMTALHPGTRSPGDTLTLQVTPFTHVAAQIALHSGQPVDAALVDTLHQALSTLLGGVDLATVQPLDVTDPDALAAGSDFRRYYAYLSAAVAGVAFGQYGGAADPFAAALNALVNAFAGGLALYDDGGSDPAFLSLKELFAEVLVQVQGNPAGDSDVETKVAETDNAARVGAGLNLLPDKDDDGTPDYADACPRDPDNDADGDGVCGDVDVCPGFDDTVDADADGTPDGCDTCPLDAANDVDGDTVCGDVDNCPAQYNADQFDDDGDGLGNPCDLCPSDPDNDSDGDGVCTGVTFQAPAHAGLDNCPSDVNPNQTDSDTDGDGDACDACPFDPDNDADGDGVCAPFDVCPGFDDHLDADFDGLPDGCDVCPGDPTNDFDGDGICAGTGFNEPATGDGDNCPDLPTPDLTDSDGDGLGDACDLCPADADNDSDGDGVCVGAAFQDPATAGGDNCPTVPNATQADANANGEGDVCEGGIITIGEVRFDPAESADLGTHSLAIPTQSAWPFIGYGNPDGFGMFFSRTTERGVAVTEVAVTPSGGGAAVYDLAKATDGAIYYLYAMELGGTGSSSEVIFDNPALFLPATLAQGETWENPLENLLWGEPVATMEVTGVGVTSPAGYTDTIAVQSTQGTSVAVQYWRTGGGLMDGDGDKDFRRADVEPVPTNAIPTTGAHRALQPGDTWTYLELGALVDADGHFDPYATQTLFRTVTTQDRIVTETENGGVGVGVLGPVAGKTLYPAGPGPLRTARAFWIDILAYDPVFGMSPFTGIDYFHQDGDLRRLGSNGIWLQSPVEGAIRAPATLSVGQTFGDAYDLGFGPEGIETYNVAQGNVGVQTPAGNFQTFRIEFSDLPVPGSTRPYADTSTDWYSPALGAKVQSIGQEEVFSKGSRFLWSDRLVDYGTVPADLDSDGDGLPDLQDNCPPVANPGQEDTRGDGVGDACRGDST